jgi:lipopolysaccharide transport system permease protein
LFGMVRREVSGRYRGSWLGLLWSLLTPILLLAIYTFIFGFVFKVRWGEGRNVDGEFAAVLFCGIILHGFLSEVLTRSPLLIIGNVNFVKKVVFPLEALSWVTVGASLFHFLLALVVLVAFLLLSGSGIALTALALPLLLVPFAFILLGISWFVAALGVYVRDTTHVAGFVATALMFLSPVFYPLSVVPEAYQDLYFLNPLTYVIIEARNSLIFGTWPEPAPLALYWLAALLTCWGGYAWFQKMRSGFADVL